jgi:FMN phosphatase YigB (HAD superfamily)
MPTVNKVKKRWHQVWHHRRVAIRAVVFDIGGVLEIIDDSVFPGAWPGRLGLGADEFLLRLDGLAGDPVVGEVTEAEIRAHWQRSLELDDATATELMEDFWRWYVGTLDEPLFDWFVARRPTLLTGILSNSGPGAREREAFLGFEQVTNDIVYSHEVGLKKPDPAIYALVERRLGVEPVEVVFLDDAPANVEAAQAAGWHAVLHESRPRSIAALEQIIATEGR